MSPAEFERRLDEPPSKGSPIAVPALFSRKEDRRRGALLDRDTTDQIRGVAILLIMLGHLSATGRFVLSPRAGAWGVTIFLVLSGYGLFRSHTTNGLDDFFRKRFSKVLVPYSIVIAALILIDVFALGMTYPPGNVILALSGFDLKASVDGTMWFISFLLLWYIAFYGIFRTVRTDGQRLLALLLVAVALFAVRDAFPAESGAYLHVLDLPFGVLLGMLAVRHEAQGLGWEPLQWWVTSALALALTLSVVFVSRMDADMFSYVIADFAVMAVVLSLFQLMSASGWGSLPLATFGRYSYGMYLLEGAILLKYTSLQPEGGWPWFIVVPVIFGLGVVLMRLVDAGMEKALAIRQARN